MDLIDRAKVERITFQEPSYSDPINVLTEVRDKVRALPAVDAEPVRHGKWIKYAPADFPYPYHHDDYECSVCSTLWASKEIKNMHYCPSCGAKMDAKRGEE